MSVAVGREVGGNERKFDGFSFLLEAPTCRSMALWRCNRKDQEKNHQWGKEKKEKKANPGVRSEGIGAGGRI